MDSPQKMGRGDYGGLYETQQEPVSQLPWHEGIMQVFETCAKEVAHPSVSSKKEPHVDGIILEAQEIFSDERNLFQTRGSVIHLLPDQ